MKQRNDEITKIMEEEHCDREAAWKIKQNRDEIKRLADSQIQKDIDEMEEEGCFEEISTLQDIYETVGSWLGIREIDHNRIDIQLATALSNKIPGTPIWMFIVGNSGDWKSAFSKAFDGLKNCKKLDQLTENTLASGAKDVVDLGSELHDTSTILLFPDLACLTSMNTDKKNIIWGQFRNLYDGFINKRTGAGIKKAYENCHVTLLACATQSLRDEILIFSHLGTRELMYDTATDPIDNDFKMDKALHNEKYEQEMTQEIEAVVCNFIRHHEVKDIDPDDEMLHYLKKEAERLTILRATAITDKQHQELINPVYPEVPTRLIKQFVRIYRCLKSLDDDYPDEKIRQIIAHIVDSSGNKVRQLVLSYLKINSGNWCNIPDIQKNTKLGRKPVKSQCETLWNMGIFDKETRVEQIGGYDSYDPTIGETVHRGGLTKEVDYYKFDFL